MKRKFFTFITLLAAGLSLSSCLNSDDDNEVVYSHDTAISAFSLGTMGRYMQRKSTKELDSLVASAVTGSDYKFTIDQANRQIYNEDSLPARTRTAAFLATISAKNSSYIQLIYAKDKLKDKKYEDSLVWYSSSDSINFEKLPYMGLDDNGNPSSNIRRNNIRVFAQDGTVYADYQLKINVHKEEADSFVWHPLVSANADLKHLAEMKALSLGNKVYVFGKTSGDSPEFKVYATSNTNGTSWDQVHPNVSFAADAYENVVAKDDKLYLLDGGTVYKSTDAKTWTVVAENTSLTRLIGASPMGLYAYTATGISSSTDNGATWTNEVVDVANLPTQNVSMSISAIRSTPKAANVLLLGTRDEAKNDTVAVRWIYTADWNDGALAGSWNFVEYEKNMAYKLPWSTYLTCSTTDGGYVALGTGTIRKGDKTISGAVWYKSLDGGLTWKEDTLVNIAKIALDVEKPVGFVRDANNYYWVINNGNVWKGRFNKDGWLKKD